MAYGIGQDSKIIICNGFDARVLELKDKPRIKKAVTEFIVVYMACDFAPADQRLEEYYRELAKAMDGAEELIVASYIAPAIALDKGSYSAVRRDAAALARRVFEVAGKNF